MLDDATRIFSGKVDALTSDDADNARIDGCHFHRERNHGLTCRYVKHRFSRPGTDSVNCNQGVAGLFALRVQWLNELELERPEVFILPCSPNGSNHFCEVHAQS